MVIDKSNWTRQFSRRNAGSIKNRRNWSIVKTKRFIKVILPLLKRHECFFSLNIFSLEMFGEDVIFIWNSLEWCTFLPDHIKWISFSSSLSSPLLIFIYFSVDGSDCEPVERISSIVCRGYVLQRPIQWKCLHVWTCSLCRMTFLSIVIIGNLFQIIENKCELFFENVREHLFSLLVNVSIDVSSDLFSLFDKGKHWMRNFLRWFLEEIDSLFLFLFDYRRCELTPELFLRRENVLRSSQLFFFVDERMFWILINWKSWRKMFSTVLLSMLIDRWISLNCWSALINVIDFREREWTFREMNSLHLIKWMFIMTNSICRRNWSFRSNIFPHWIENKLVNE